MVAVLEREVSVLDASRIDEIRSSLEGCFSQVSTDTQVLEVYAELAQLEGKNLAEVLSYPKIISQKLSLASEFQKQASSYHDIVDFYIEQLTQAKSHDDNELASEMTQKGIETLQKARQAKTRGLEVLTELIDNYWNYLTVESQAKFKDWAKSLLENAREWAKEYQVKEGSEELRLAYLDFIAAIITADDLNSSKPKLRTANIEQKSQEKKESKEQHSSSEEEKLLDRLKEFNSGCFRNTSFSYKELYQEARNAVETDDKEELIATLRSWREEYINELDTLSGN
ncbi:MAG: hypothetical protein AB1589_21250 [Cyanobacteriota bacterium]